jgi:hypothetical protein
VRGGLIRAIIGRIEVIADGALIQNGIGIPHIHAMPALLEAYPDAELMLVGIRRVGASVELGTGLGRYL